MRLTVVRTKMDEPSTLTFLFTDIEGSTSKWEEQPEQMAQAVGRHDALLRDAVHAHGGRIVKTTGDGIYAAFATPADGLLAVIEIQLALLDPATTSGLGFILGPFTRATTITSAARSIAPRAS